MSRYTLNRIHSVVYAKQERLIVNYFQFSFSGNADTVLNKRWRKALFEIVNAVVCTAENKHVVPDILDDKQRVTEIKSTENFAQALAEYLSDSEVAVEVSLLDVMPNHASLIQFFSGTFSHSILETDRKELLGKSIYVSTQPLDMNHPDIVHITPDADSNEIDDTLLCLRQGRIMNGYNSTITITL